MSRTIPPLASYQERSVDSELDVLLGKLPAVSLEGAKGVGKTETARRRAQTTFDLDQPGILEVVKADPHRLVSAPPPVLIDEWQRYPPSWDLVRRAVDSDRTPGRFILTGSASPESPGTHSGAGRIVTVRMRPMSLAERGTAEPTVSLSELLTGSRPRVVGTTDVRLNHYVDEILVGGFPGMRANYGRAHRAQFDGYIDRIVDREFPDMGLLLRNPVALRRWLAAYAAATSTTTSYDRIRDAATSGQDSKPARTTTRPYRDTLERLWILDPVSAWLPSRNPLSKLGSARKHHLADPALAARMMGLDSGALLDDEPGGSSITRDGTLLGALFESLVTLSVRVYAQEAEAAVHHMRTHGGAHEVDLIVVRGDQRILALEIKLSATVDDNDTRHLRWLMEKVGTDVLDAVVVTTGHEAYRRADGIAVVPAALLGP